MGALADYEHRGRCWYGIKLQRNRESNLVLQVRCAWAE